RFVLFGDRKSYTGHGPCLYLRPSTNLRKISGVIKRRQLVTKPFKHKGCGTRGIAPDNEK
ncbi:MAG: hypothetical protein KH620_09450, partial [Collinsella sp.]|nr:hypothetical protein [Collinsella sp.]